jgi:hypothetical protein
VIHNLHKTHGSKDSALTPKDLQNWIVPWSLWLLLRYHFTIININKYVFWVFPYEWASNNLISSMTQNQLMTKHSYSKTPLAIVQLCLLFWLISYLLMVCSLQDNQPSSGLLAQYWSPRNSPGNMCQHDVKLKENIQRKNSNLVFKPLWNTHQTSSQARGRKHAARAQQKVRKLHTDMPQST